MSLRLALLTLSLVACSQLHDPLDEPPHVAERADAGAAPRAPAAQPDAGTKQGNGYSILEPYLVNARDLGGTPLAEEAHVAYGMVFRGPPMAALYADGCSAFADLGIHSVIDLRDPSEVETKPADACVREHAAMVSAPLPIPYAVSPEDYIAIIAARASMLRIFRVLADPQAYPVYFHCTWGRDRTGVVAALVLRALGASRDDILDEYLLSITTVGAYPQSLIAALDEVERLGGIDAYLRAVGVTPEELQALRDNAIARLP